MRPRGQRWLPGYEGSDAGSGHLDGSLDMHLRVPERAGLESVGLLFFALSLKRSGDCPVERFARHARRRAQWGGRSVQSDAEFVALGSVLRTARHAASLRRLAGAETARFH